MRAAIVVLLCPFILPAQDPAAEPLTASHVRHERLFQQLNSLSASSWSASLMLTLKLDNGLFARRLRAATTRQSCKPVLAGVFASPDQNRIACFTEEEGNGPVPPIRLGGCTLSIEGCHPQPTESRCRDSPQKRLASHLLEGRVRMHEQ